MFYLPKDIKNYYYTCYLIIKSDEFQFWSKQNGTKKQTKTHYLLAVTT